MRWGGEALGASHTVGQKKEEETTEKAEARPKKKSVSGAPRARPGADENHVWALGVKGARLLAKQQAPRRCCICFFNDSHASAKANIRPLL